MRDMPRMPRLLFISTLLLATGFALAEDGSAAKAKKRAPQPQPAPTSQAAPAPPATPAAPAEPTDKDKKPQTKEGGNLGMSILGNQEAPKSLVIVPWKTSQLGGTLGISPMLDDSRQPVDKEVFLRALSYYEIRSEKKK